MFKRLEFAAWFALFPDEVDVSLTPEAAEETADRLTEKAVVARGQRRLRRNPHQPK